MEEQKVAKLKEDLKRLVDSLVGLCPAYNSVTRILRDIRGKPITNIVDAYPQIFKPEVMALLTSMFGFQAGVKMDISSVGVGYDTLTLVGKLEELLDKDEIRMAIGMATGEEPPNPAKDYVEACVTTLQEKDLNALKLLQMCSETGYATFEGLIKLAKEKHGLELDKKSLAEHLGRLDDLGLLSYFTENRIDVRDLYKRHVIDLIRT